MASVTYRKSKSRRTTRKQSNRRIKSILSLQTSIPTVALMFLTMADHAHPQIWNTFLHKHQHKFDVFCHPYLPFSKKDRIPDGAHVIQKNPRSFLNGHVIPNRVPTRWGHLVNAYYALLQTAYRQAPRAIRFVYLSDTCVPVIPPDEVYRRLLADQNATFIDSPRPHENADRYHQEKSRIDRRPVAPRLKKVGIRRVDFFKHGGWFAPCRRDAQRLLAHRDAFNALNYVSAGDEHILSILKRRKYDSDVCLQQRPITYVYWDLNRKLKWQEQKMRLWHEHDSETDPKQQAKLMKEIQLCRHAYMHPEEWKTLVTKTDVNTFQRSGCLFARKIMPGCNITLLRKAIE